MLQKLLRLKPRQVFMIPEAIWLTAWYRFQVLYRPFSKLSPKIGTLGQETPWDARRDPVVTEVRGMVEAVSKRMPWNCNCLTQALTAKKMLSRRNFPSTLYMGVASGESGEMEAHAWLRYGNMYITGRAGADKFTVTTVYGENTDTEKGIWVW